MRTFRALFLAAVLFWGAGLCQQTAAPETAKKPASPAEKKSLVRKDLLRLDQAEAAFPKRNIFAPRTSSGVSPIPPVLELAPRTPNASELEGEEDTEADSQRQPQISVNLRYIGYIESAKKMIALIILDGQALAVAEGEVVSEGLRIGKIAATEIEIILPDSTSRKFSLEGE